MIQLETAEIYPISEYEKIGLLSIFKSPGIE